MPLMGSANLCTPERLRAMVADGEGARRTLTASKLIICAPRRSVNDLVAKIQGKIITVHVVGDAKLPRSYANGIHESAYMSRHI